MSLVKNKSCPLENIHFTLNLIQGKTEHWSFVRLRTFFAAGFPNKNQNFKVIEPTKVSAEVGCVQLFRKIL